MKMKYYPAIALFLLLAACGNSDREYDASGVFETDEVIVSARGTGELIQFNLEEGQNVIAGEQLGYIDTVQLHLQKLQLQANIQAIESRHYNIAKQIASIQQQIATQKKEQSRYRKLVEANAANQKQLDDIDAQITLLEKELEAQTETLENNNKSIAGESSGIKAQIALINDQIEKNIVTSPISGTVLSKYAEQGELAAQGRALFKVADIEDMKLRAYITADQLTGLTIGQSVKVYADEGISGRKEYPGTIIWISDKAEFTPKTIQTRDERANLVYAVKIAVKNDGYIKKGMYGELKIE
ncbi:MAG TPA: HlyD family efflux transporter periplasmic adaptor subunit [Candidatus Avirikenella pullistercoris]|nr:HlyD family efflux transporter periplasmic adaptor subunit [Candidatus Avirikenella pullistercoris]